RFFFFFQAEDGIRDFHVTGVQTCALPISTDRLRRHLWLTVHRCLLLSFPRAYFTAVPLPSGSSCRPVGCGSSSGVVASCIARVRSEERRVGKEGGGRGAAVR